jgi:hypothetical protein
LLGHLFHVPYQANFYLSYATFRGERLQVEICGYLNRRLPMSVRAAVRRMEPPTDADINRAVRYDFSVSNVSAVKVDRSLFLNIALRTGGKSTVVLDELRARRLLATLKALVPNSEDVAAASVFPGLNDRLEVWGGSAVKYGAKAVGANPRPVKRRAVAAD